MKLKSVKEHILPSTKWQLDNRLYTSKQIHKKIYNNIHEPVIHVVWYEFSNNVRQLTWNLIKDRLPHYIPFGTPR